MKKKLCKSKKNKVISGVCGGLADYLNIDPAIVRIIVLLLVFLKGFGLLVYLICFLIMPPAEDDVLNDDVENLKSANEDSAGNNGNSSAHTDEEFDEFFKK